jgi:DNA modification methylase
MRLKRIQMEQRNIKHQTIDIDSIQAHPKNVRQGDIGAISESLKAHGQYRPIVVDERTGQILAGNHTWKAAKALGWSQIQVSLIQTKDDDEALRILLADNKATDLADYDNDGLEQLLKQLAESDNGLLGSLYDGDDLDLLINDNMFVETVGVEDKFATNTFTGAIAQRFGIAPFSIMDCRRSWWKQRRDYWLKLGIESEVGRNEKLKFSDTILNNAGRDKNLTLPNSAIYEYPNSDKPQYNGTSVFDPVICEIAYRWYCPNNGYIFDPFAGGSVRGIVAAHLGMNYVGVELRSEQVEANNEQKTKLGEGAGSCEWINGDSRTVDLNIIETPINLIFSCPPYFDLEQYSDDENDLSNCKTYESFLIAYKEIITRSVNLLADNSFAVWIVSEIRDEQGNYRNFVGDTINAFEQAGMKYYNECVYVQQSGSWAMRIGRMFGASRKIARIHQNILIFAKGDPFATTKTLGEGEWGYDNEPDLLEDLNDNNE